jgi:hypothetical protein
MTSIEYPVRRRPPDEKQPGPGTRGRRWPPSRSLLERLVKEATGDAYGDSEQRTAFLSVLQDSLGLPFDTLVLGAPVTVERVDLTPAEEIVAICRRGRERQAIPILNLPLPSPRPEQVRSGLKPTGTGRADNSDRVARRHHGHPDGHLIPSARVGGIRPLLASRCKQMVPEPGLEPGLPCGKGILRQRGKGGESRLS